MTCVGSDRRYEDNEVYQKNEDGDMLWMTLRKKKRMAIYYFSKNSKF